MRVLIVVAIFSTVVSFIAANESRKIKALEAKIERQAECIQNIKNSRDEDFNPGPLGYSICDIDPFNIVCPCRDKDYDQ